MKIEFWSRSFERNVGTCSSRNAFTSARNAASSGVSSKSMGSKLRPAHRRVPTAPASRAWERVLFGHILEGNALVDPRLGRQLQHLLADRVALDLVGAAADAGHPLTEELVLPEAPEVRALLPQHPGGAGNTHHQIALMLEPARRGELDDRALGAGQLPARRCALG